LQVSEVGDLPIETGDAVAYFGSSGAGGKQRPAEFLHAWYCVGVDSDRAPLAENLLQFGLPSGNLLL
jgi:hypothetical protein